MKPHPIIDFERRNGRTNEEVVRRLYVTETPVALRDKEAALFDISNSISKFFDIPIYQIKAAGSAQTGYSFHNNSEFKSPESDYDVAVISADVFERYVRAVQRMALPDPESLEKPDRSLFPSKKGKSYYNDYMESITFHGVLMPHHMPTCPEKGDLMKMNAKLSEKYAEIFKNINVAIYLSVQFFERKQRPNLGFYDNMVQR